MLQEDHLVSPETVGRCEDVSAGDETSSAVDSHPATAPPPPLLLSLQQDVPGSLLCAAGYSAFCNI